MAMLDIRLPPLPSYLLENENRLALPYTRPKSKEGLMKKTNLSMMNMTIAIFVRGEKMSYRTTTNEGYLQN